MTRLILLTTSPRVAPGLLSRDAWSTLQSAAAVCCADLDDPLAAALSEAGVTVTVCSAAGTDSTPSMADLARMLVDRALGEDVVWLVSADGDPGLSDAIATEVSSRERAPDVEVLLGSWDVPGARLLDVVAAMDRLRSPGGCPWDAEQTHESLAPYLVEETYETLDAVASGDRSHLAEELGDVLLQVVFHARVAEEAPEPGDRFDIDDVAGHLVDKLVRRHPHVFADGDATSPEQVEQAWERIKAAERSSRGGADDSRDLLRGIPSSLPVQLTADKVMARARRRGLQLDQSAADDLTRALADLSAAQEHALAAVRRLALSAHPDPDHRHQHESGPDDG